jgi:hypothetical protein
LQNLANLVPSIPTTELAFALAAAYSLKIFFNLFNETEIIFF